MTNISNIIVISQKYQLSNNVTYEIFNLLYTLKIFVDYIYIKVVINLQSSYFANLIIIFHKLNLLLKDKLITIFK